MKRTSYEFYTAIGNGYLPIVKYLVGQGADIHAFYNEAL